MKFLFDLFPVFVFFIAFKLAGIYAATAMAIAATFLQVGYLALRRKKIEPMLWASLAIIVVFGGLTLVLEDKRFIMWKPTILYWLFAAVLGGGLLAGKNLIRSLLSKELQLPEPTWTRLGASWIAFFAVMGVLNLYVAYNFSENDWVNFKLFGATGLLLLFIVGQALVLARHVEEPKSGEEKS